MSSSLLQVVNNLFQTCYNTQGTSSANTTCWQLVNRLVTTCLQTCNNVQLFSCSNVLPTEIRGRISSSTRYFKTESTIIDKWAETNALVVFYYTPLPPSPPCQCCYDSHDAIYQTHISHRSRQHCLGEGEGAVSEGMNLNMWTSAASFQISSLIRDRFNEFWQCL